jgi:hypothetical protein
MSFNLDINTYTSTELEEILGLLPPFTKQDISNKASLLIKNIQSDGSVAPDLKNNTVDFIKKVEDKLVSKTNVVAPVINVVQTPLSADLLPQIQYAPVELTSDTHDVIIRPQIPYTMSFPQEYQPGILNPIERRVIRYLLNIDTRFRDSYMATSSTNCAFNLPNTFAALNMQLTSIEIPNSYYVISRQSGNNNFSISAGNEKIIYIIPDGNYGNQELADYLNNYADNNGYTSTTNPLLYYMTFNVNIIGQLGSGSGQFVIGINPSYDSSLFNFTVNFNEDINGNIDKSTPIIMKLGWLLGFRESIYTGNSAYVSEGVIDLYGPRYLYLAIDDYNTSVNGGFYGAFNNNLLQKNILARISISNATKANFNINSWNNMNVISYPRQYFGPVNMLKLGIQLLNEYGVPINLNNMDFSFCLSFDVPYNV